MKILAGRMVVASLLSVCAAVTAAQTPEETRLEMNIGGRTVVRDHNGQSEWLYQWPAIYFEANFTGDRVDLHVDDTYNNFNVLIDGHAVMVLKKPGMAVVPLEHLGPGVHAVRLEKRTEDAQHVGAFGGFFVQGEPDALPALASPRRIEFIGDSLTVGWGNSAASIKCNQEEIFEGTNSQEGFGPLVAKHYKADYRVNAMSGIGLVRNSGGLNPEFHLPKLLQRALFWENSSDATPWAPQIIVIGIGVNDFSPLKKGEQWKNTGKLAADYEKTYVELVKGLRSQLPDALIVMTWMEDWGEDFPRSALRVFKTLRADGVTNLERVIYPPMERTGCMTHFNLRDDARIAGLLEAVIDRHPEAWAQH